VANISLLVGHRLDDVVKHGYSWEFVFSGALNFQVGCLWRLIVLGRIAITGEDHGQQFGLPAPVDCVKVLRQHVIGASVTDVKVRTGTLDVSLEFGTGTILEVIPNSAGYEAWQLNGRDILIVGQPGYES
jgi:hypothetical protein